MNMGRAFEILDIIANAIGATIGILIFIWLRPKSAVEN
jgi:glycopeptide antibiotics resistance protein